MKSAVKLTCLLLFYLLFQQIAAESKTMKCSEKSLDYLLDNRDMIYQNFLHSTRGPNPHHPANINAGICCLAVSNVEVPVGSSARFASPNYPNKYPSDLDCGWNFKTDPGHVFDMKCHFKHLKRNDYLDMKENNSLYSYVENVKEKDMIHYFWHNEVSVGFHSDRETGVEGFECEIWPVAECAHPERIEEEEIESSEDSLQFEPFMVRYYDGDYKVYTEDVFSRSPREFPSSLQKNLERETSGLLNKLPGLFLWCESTVGKCYYLADSSQSWKFLKQLQPLDSANLGALYFAVSIQNLAIFGGTKYIYEMDEMGSTNSYMVPWADEAETQCLATDGKTLFAVYNKNGMIYIAKQKKSSGGEHVASSDYDYDYEKDLAGGVKSKYETIGSYMGTTKYSRSLGCLITGNKIYIAGVLYGQGSSELSYLTVSPLDEKIDDSNTDKLPLPLKLKGPSMAIIDERPAIVGGFNLDTEKISDSIFILDSDDTHFTTAPLKLKPGEMIYQLFQQ